MRNCLSPPQPLPAPYGSAGSAKGQRRSNPGVTGYLKPDKTRLRTRTTHLITATYNARSICSESQLSLLLNESEKIKCDIIGISETKREYPLTAVTPSGLNIYLGARKTGSISGGVGFLVAAHIAPRISRVCFLNHRLATLELNYTPKKSITVIQAYAPTADSEDAEHEEFYNLLLDVIQKSKSFYKIVMGDFNARVGRRMGNEKFIGPHSADIRNEAGDRLVTFCETNRFFVCNSFYQKPPKRRWTHISPNAQYKNEIDYILCNRRASTDVTVLASFNTGSDHRLVRAKFHFDRTADRMAINKSRKPRPTILDGDRAATLASSCSIPEFDNIDIDYENFTNIINNIRKEAQKMAPNHSSQRISESTKALLEKRRWMKRETNNLLELSSLNKLCRMKVKEDHDSFRRSRLLEAAEKGLSVRRAARSIAEYKHTIPCLKKSDGSRTTAKFEIEETIRDFYTDLFKSSQSTVHHTYSKTSEPEFLVSEIRHVIENSPNGKSPGDDGITGEILKACGPPMYSAITGRFNRYLKTKTVPSPWKTSKSIILHKKGDREDLSNYRPISLLSTLYKIFTTCVYSRIRPKLEENQPIEQAGFRRGFSTLDHISTCSRLIEVSREYQLPLILTFIDFKKAFDTIEHNFLWRALKDQGIEDDYIDLLTECYSDCTTKFKPFHRNIEVRIEKGVRQGDPISPGLFSACLESVVRRCEWENFGISIDGRNLNHLRFADDIVLITNVPEDATLMLEQLSREGNKAGLVINIEKTKVMRNGFAPRGDILLNNISIEDVTEFVYLGRLLTMTNDLMPELRRRRRAGWAAFGTIRHVMEATRDANLKAHLFNSNVLPALSYASETWALTKVHENKIKVIQAALERRLVGLTLWNQRRLNLHNEDVRNRSQVKDMMVHVDEAKHNWAGHVMRRRDDRWSAATQLWIPRHIRRPLGRPPIRWGDSLSERNTIREPGNRHSVLKHWTTVAKERDAWRASWDSRAPNRRTEERVAK